jgi:hypothetical protein
MRFVKLILVCLALVCATSFFDSFAQSGRTLLPQSTPTPTPDLKSSTSGVGHKSASTDNVKYKVVFANKATMSSFVDQLNGEEGYRLKTATYGYQNLFGWSYSIPVGILQSDGTQFEYASFEVISRLFFAISGFEQKYAEQSKNGFRLVDHFLSHAVCDEQSSEDLIRMMPVCATTYQFLLEREKGANAPTAFVMAEATPTFKRNPGGTLGSAILEKWAEGFYPATVLTNYQVLLAHADKKTDLQPEPLEVQVVNSSFMNTMKKKIKTLGQQGFRLSVIGQECAVMYRSPNERNPVSYEWLDAKNKKLEKELGRLQKSGAVYRMVYRYQPYSNELVFERPINGSAQSAEYRVLKLSFQLVDPPLRKGVRVSDARVELTPEAKNTVKLLNDLAREGFVVRDLFRPEFISNNVHVLLERSK